MKYFILYQRYHENYIFRMNSWGGKIKHHTVIDKKQRKYRTLFLLRKRKRNRKNKWYTERHQGSIMTE